MEIQCLYKESAFVVWHHIDWTDGQGACSATSVIGLCTKLTDHPCRSISCRPVADVEQTTVFLEGREKADLLPSPCPLEEPRDILIPASTLAPAIELDSENEAGLRACCRKAEQSLQSDLTVPGLQSCSSNSGLHRPVVPERVEALPKYCFHGYLMLKTSLRSSPCRSWGHALTMWSGTCWRKYPDETAGVQSDFRKDVREARRGLKEQQRKMRGQRGLKKDLSIVFGHGK